MIILIIFIALVIWLVYLGISSDSNGTHYIGTKRSDAERDIEDLRRMKKYEFWRDFEK